MEQLNVCQSYPFNQEVENYDDPVEFLNEVRVSCLICGADTEIDNIVKQEICQFDEDTPNNQEYPLGVDGSSVTNDVFHWFLKWFSVDIRKNGKERLIDRGWDGEGGDILRFCGSCKKELKDILELQKQLDELEEKVKNGLMSVKGKIERFEETFQSNGAYDKDQRYKMVRTWILKNEMENLGHQTQTSLQSSLRIPVDHINQRKSLRLKRKRNSTEILSNSPASLQNSPTKLAMKIVRKNMSTQTVTKIGRKKVRKKIHSRHISVKQPNKEAPQKVQVTNCSIKLHRITIPTNFVRSEDKTKAVHDIIGVPIDKVVNSNKDDSVEQPIISSDPTANPDVSSDVIVCAKKSPPKIAKKIITQKFAKPAEKIVEQQVVRRTSTRIAKKIVQKSANSQQPPKTTTNLMRQRSSKISQKVTTEHETTAIEGDHESSEDDNNDVERKSKSYKRKYSYKLDPFTSTITFEGIKFSISSDQKKVCCTLCNVSLFNRKGYIRLHFIKHHSTRFACSQCSFRGTSISRLDTHIKAAHEGIPVIPKIPCRICGKPVICARDHEWTHMSKKEQEKVLQKKPENLPSWFKRKRKCERCGKLIPAQEMQNHKLKCNGSEKPKEKCPQCGKYFGHLKEHIKYIHVPATYECTEQGCGRKFKKLSWLTDHKNFVHWKLKPWKCTKCPRQYSRKLYLKQHMDLHMGIRRWKCEVKGCGAAYASKWHLREHNKRNHEKGGMPNRKPFRGRPIESGSKIKGKEVSKIGAK